MNKKYELVNFNSESGLYQIKALYDFGDVKAGDLGGWVAGERNLSHHGNCWIYDNGCVYENGQVLDDGRVYDNGCVYSNGRVFGNGKLCNYGTIIGDGIVFENGCVTDNGMVSGNGQVYANGRVSGYGLVSNNSTVSGNAHVSGQGRVSGYGLVSGNATITSSKDLMIFSNVGSENGILTLYKTVDGFGANRGCFNGTIEEFLKAVEKKHGDSTYAKQYRKMVEIFMMNFD